MRVILVFILLSLVSCNRGYYINDQGGFRLKKKHLFRYEKKKYVLKDTLLIDTNAIYIRKNDANAYGIHCCVFDSVYYRFWSNGRVQEVYCMHKNINKLVNNIDCGDVGYYYIKKGRLKIQLIGKAEIGWAAWLQFGYFTNRNIGFYEQLPSTNFGSYIFTKWESGSNKSIWIKTKVDSLKYVKPNW